MKIYTRKGDQGQTRLIGGSQVSKSSTRLESYGAVDELNSSLGLCLCEIDADSTRLQSAKPDLGRELILIQNELFCIGSLLACEDEAMRGHLPKVPDTAIARMETSIDEMTAQLPELKEFILPGGSRLSAALQMARTICRRAERQTVPLLADHPETAAAITYLNRLSDYLFTAGRFANHLQGRREQVWVKP